MAPIKPSVRSVQDLPPKGGFPKVIIQNYVLPLLSQIFGCQY
jgi:hypothetical protein